VEVARIIVGIGQLMVVNSPTVLVGAALGSCVGLMLYDEHHRVAGLAHIMLPSSSDGRVDGLPAKFADRAIPLMLVRLEELGGKATYCRAKLAGGAQMFLGGDGIRRNVGVRNVEVVKVLLDEYRIPVLAEDTGGDHARTVEFDTGNFEVSIRSIIREQKKI